MSADNAKPTDAEMVSNSSSQTLVELSDLPKRANESTADQGQLENDPQEASNGDETAASPATQTDSTVTKDVVEPKATDDDVVMDDIEEPQSIDQKVLTALEHQKRSSGTDQQDVEEVIGSMINRLQAAIKPSAVDDETGIQFEKIMETFFVTTVNYTKKFEETNYQHEISFDRSITAFPAPDGPCSLYEALGRNFDQQVLEESKLSRYTAIKKLPPVLHVLIQRSQSIGRKNDNAVIIPETLYLDRYMDAPHDSPLFKRRTEDWTIANRLADLKTHKAQAEQYAPSGPGFVGYFTNKTASEFDAVDVAEVEFDDDWDFDGPTEEDFLLISPSNPNEATQMDTDTNDKGNELPTGIIEVEEHVREMLNEEISHHERTLEEHFEDLKEIPYRLQAVICHRGHLSSGHYWVWIHDFEDKVWRWYNDAEVRENPNTQEVLETLSKSGEPYYLCYVRDSDKDDFVDVPKRQPDELPQSAPANSPETKTDSEGDVAVPDLEADTADGSPKGSIKLGTTAEIRLD
jgi:ubiquitin carboxyl-terminal hydrolase 25